MENDKLDIANNIMLQINGYKYDIQCIKAHMTYHISEPHSVFPAIVELKNRMEEIVLREFKQLREDMINEREKKISELEAELKSL